MASNNRRTSARPANQRKFLLSGFTDHEKAELALKIIKLGSKYLEVGEYVNDVSHIICVKPMRSEKYLCACASGKWVLSKDYIYDSVKEGKWLKEEPYQWGIRHLNKAVGQTSMARAPAKWHRIVQETGKRSFSRWKVAIFVENKKRKPAVYKRVIECGDGKVVSVKLPIKDADAMATQLTHVLVDKTYEDDVKPLVVRGVPCVLPDFLAEHLFEEHPDMNKFLVGKSQVVSESIVNSRMSSTRSSSRSSRANSKVNSPLKRTSTSPLKRTLTPSGEKVVVAVAVNGTRRSNRSSCVSSKANSPVKKETTTSGEIATPMETCTTNNQSQHVASGLNSTRSSTTSSRRSSCVSSRDNSPLKVPPENLLEYETYQIGIVHQPGTCFLIAGFEYIRNRTENDKTFLRCRHRNSCFAKAVILHEIEKAVINWGDHAHPAPTEIPEERCKPIVESSAQQKAEKRENMPPPKGVKKQTTLTAASFKQPSPVLKPSSAPATAAVNTPVKSSAAPDIIQAELKSVNLQDVKETVVRNQERDPLSFVPYWMQVSPPKRKTGDQCALPFPKIICHVIEGLIEEGQWLQAVTMVTSNLSISKFPPAEIIHVIMQEMMKSESSTIAGSGYHMLKSILCLHNPMTNPALGQIYLQSMLPPEREFDGFEIEEDSPIRSHWDFMDRVIRNSFPSMFDTEDTTKEEKERARKFQMNHQLLLKYLVSLLEHDFNGYQQRCVNSNGRKPVRCIMSSILWPSGHHKTITSSLKHLLRHFINAVKHTQQDESMCTLLRMLSSMVRFAAELLHLDNPSLIQQGVCTQDGPLVQMAYEMVSMATQDGLLDNTECLHILLTSLEPSWLKMCVSDILLQDYDDCLVLSQYKSKATESLSLEKVVHYFFYLLPRATAISSSSSSSSCDSQSSQESMSPISPLKKTTRNPRMSKALQTLADSNHINRAGKKRKLDNGADPKLGSPTKRRRIAQLNKRNAKGETQLLMACIKNDIPKLRQLLTSPGETQLHVACIKNDIPKLRQLLTSPGIQVNMTDFAGWTPLHEAANHGHVQCIKEILKFKPQANIMAYLDKESRKAYGGVDLLAAPAECGTTPLHDAVQNGHLEVVRLLVQAGGKSVLMAKNVTGLSPEDLAFTDEMKLALKSEKPQSLRRSRGSPPTSANIKSPSNVKGQNDHTLSSSCPSEELYATVLGSTQKPKLFVSAIQAERFCMIVHHLLRAYVHTLRLVEIKAEVERRLAVESKQRHPVARSKDSPGSLFSSPNLSSPGSSFSLPNMMPTLPLVKLRDIRKKADIPEVKLSDDVLMKDLVTLDNIERHITAFIHHVGHIGPWVGQPKSSMCKALFLELRLLALAWQT